LPSVTVSDGIVPQAHLNIGRRDAYQPKVHADATPNPAQFADGNPNRFMEVAVI
jgi:hypothetical protein